MTSQSDFFPWENERDWTSTRWSIGSFHFTWGAPKPLQHERDVATNKKSRGQRRKSASTSSSINKPPKATPETQNIKVIPPTAEVRDATVLEKSKISFLFSSVTCRWAWFHLEHTLCSPDTWPSTSVYKVWIHEDPNLWTTQISIQPLNSLSLASLLISKSVEKRN